MKSELRTQNLSEDDIDDIYDHLDDYFNCLNDFKCNFKETDFESAILEATKQRKVLSTCRKFEASEEFYCRLCWVDLIQDDDCCELCQRKIDLDREHEEKKALGYL